jgi:LysR family transcriptional regulator (chromosome initiation inhibitor)
VRFFCAISTYDHALLGCILEKLGDMHYLLVTASSFIASYFPEGINKQTLA